MPSWSGRSGKSTVVCSRGSYPWEEVGDVSGRTRPARGRSLVPVVIVPGSVVTLIALVDVSSIVPIVAIVVRLPLAGLLGVLSRLVAFDAAFPATFGLSFGPAPRFVVALLLFVGQPTTGAFLGPDVLFADVVGDLAATPWVVVFALESLPVRSTDAGVSLVVPGRLPSLVTPPAAFSATALAVEPLFDGRARSPPGFTAVGIGRLGSTFRRRSTPL